MMPKDIAEIRKLLKHAWTPFFTRFGKLTAVQVETIPKIVSGQNVLVSAPTASGKTESVVAPLAERLKREQWKGLSILYIVPTRALANDTFVRVHGPLGDMNISSAIKHGDSPYLSQKEEINFLITTPESLDSLICRGSDRLADVKAVVLDELHLLDNTHRGDQLRVLLMRLRQLVSDFMVCITSATVADPQEIASRYARNCDIVSVTGQRIIEEHFFSTVEEALRFAKKQGVKKTLWFANKRETVEEVGKVLKPLFAPYPVVVHHGSLGRKEREDAEQVMKEQRIAACVATMTLEIGVDIGDIDLIILLDPPWSVSSFLQRIGRGNRRTNMTKVGCVNRKEDYLSVYQGLLKSARVGALPTPPYAAHRSVLIQQVFSMLFQGRTGLSLEEFYGCVRLLSDKQDLDLILRNLCERGFIEVHGELFYSTEKLLNMGERGFIHSNIANDNSTDVIDAATGKTIGSIGGSIDSVFVLAGRVWKVVHSDDKGVKVERTTGPAESALFNLRTDRGAFDYLLPKEFVGR